MSIVQAFRPANPLLLDQEANNLITEHHGNHEAAFVHADAKGFAFANGGFDNPENLKLSFFWAQVAEHIRQLGQVAS